MYYLITVVMFNNLWYYCNCYIIILSFSLCFFCLLLAKIYNFWQVCSFVGLLLAKIYNFWQVCSFVGLSVCLSVSLSVLSSITHERFNISSPNLVHIWNG